jgi:hypothetical protein
MLENIPIPVLVDAVFRIMGLSNKKEPSLSELEIIVDKMPDSETKQAFRVWILEGITRMDELREKASSYFSGLMDQAQATTNAYSRSFVIQLSIMIVIIFGVDTIQLAKDLSVNTDFRDSIILAQANAALDKGGPDTDLSSYVQRANESAITIGWWQMEGKPIQPGTTAMDWFIFIFLKLEGLAITAFAISPGVGFWFDILQKLK